MNGIKWQAWLRLDGNPLSRKSGSWPGKVERQIPQEIWYLERRISLFFSSTENKPCPSVVPRRAHPLVAPRGSSRQMLEGAEEAEAAEASLESRRIWSPVCGEQTDAIGAAAAVASVLRRPSSVALKHVLSELSSYLEPRSVMAVHLTCKHARGNVDLLVQVNRQLVQQLMFWKNNVSVTPLSGLDITLTIKWSAFERDPRSVEFDQDVRLQ